MLHGHEVKVSRSDWIAELRDPEKAEAFARFCDFWWLVVADRSIVRDDLPDGWGLMVASGDTLRAIRKPTRRRLQVTTTPPGAAGLVRDLTDWLLLHLDRIAAHPGGPEFLHDVAHTIEAVYSRFPLEARPDRPHWRRPCEVCGALAVTADWKPEADIRDVTVWCESCPHVLIATTSDGTVQVGVGSEDQSSARRAATGRWPVSSGRSPSGAPFPASLRCPHDRAAVSCHRESTLREGRSSRSG